MTKLLLLDKDGTLVKPVYPNRFPQHPQDQEWIEGAKEALEFYCNNRWKPVIVSNQGGVDVGYKTLVEAAQEMLHVMKSSEHQIKTALFCPDMDGEYLYEVTEGHPPIVLPGGNYIETPLCFHWITWEQAGFPRKISFRKPSPGMLLYAIKELDLEDVLMVGDREEDKKAAKAAMIPFISAEEWIQSIKGKH